jgi:acyl-CoA synthetase (AMP-forming)/AMP-acid ligase II
MPSMEARLVDENGKDVAAGESGELWVRGKNIMLRYHNNEKATKETVNQDGWLMTGDVCIRSVDGHFTIVDRTKERKLFSRTLLVSRDLLPPFAKFDTVIKVKGFQAPPAVIEGILLQSEMVADAAVIGIWYESEATEYPRAYIVVEPKFANEPNLVEKITNFVAARVAPHLRIKGGIRFIDVIPKSRVPFSFCMIFFGPKDGHADIESICSAAGKILRKDLRVLAAQEAETGTKL